ncbi:MAG: beta strand repeat-containing protein, partial [Pirellula sp.]
GVATSVVGSFGSINIASDGTYTYTVDNNNASVQALRSSSNTLQDVFTYRVADTAGLTSLATITVTIQGTNDAPWDSGFAAGTGLNFSGSGEVALSGLGVNTAAGATTTVEFWMNWNGTNYVMPFGFTHTDLYFSGTSFGFNTCSSDVYGIASAGLANGWRHIAAVFHNGNVTQNQLFVDGVQQTLTQRIGTSNNANAYVTNSAKISGWLYDSGYKFTGGIDEVRIWNGTRTQSQIQANMYSSLSGPVSGLLAAYNFDNVTLGVGGVTDVSGNGRSGTSSGLTAGNIVSTGWSATGVTLGENTLTGTVIGSVRGYDYDAGDTLSYSLFDNAGGRFAVTSGGVLSVADGSLLNHEAATNHTIVLRTTDAAGLTFDKTLTINLTDVNETPTAVADSATAVEAGGVSNGTAGTNPTGNVLTNDTDVDAGDTRAVTGVLAGTQASATGNVGSSVNGSYGSISIAANGAYTYDVDNSNAAVQALRTSGNTLHDVFTYTMRDTVGLTSTTQITVTIQGANDAPTDITGTLTIAENSANASSVGTVSTTDIDAGDGFTYALTNNAGGRFAINATTGQVTVANSSLLDFETNASHSITVQVTDTAGATFSKAITVSVTNVNEAPTAITVTSAATTMQFDTSGTLLQNSQGTAIVTATSAVAGYDAARGGVAQISAGGQFNVSASAPTLGSNFTLFARFKNLYISEQGYNTLFRGVTDHQLLLNVSTKELGYFDNNTNGFRGTGYVASGLDDGQWHSAAVVNSGGIFTYYIDGTKVGNTITDSSTTTLGWIGGMAAGQAFSQYLDDFRYFGSSLSAAQVATLNSDTEAALTIAENSASGTYVGSVIGRDVDASTALTYSLTDSAGGRFAVNISNGAITVANSSLLNFEANTSHAIVVRATDQGGLTFDQTVTIGVSNVNEAPTAVADTAIAVEAGGTANAIAGTNPTGNVLTNDTDVDTGDTKTVSGVAAGVVGSASTNVGSAVAGTYGSINISSTGAYTYTVDNSNAALQALRLSGQTIQDVFTYTMRDAAGVTSTTHITVTIQGANDAPHDITATLIIAENSANGSVAGTVIGQDVDNGDSFTYSLTDTAGGRFAINSSTGQVTVANGSLIDFETASSHNITVRVTDASGATFDKVMTVAVTNVNEAPVMTSTGGIDNNVSLLLNGDGANGSTAIIDSSLSPKTVTAFGDAQISTAQSKFGGASLGFNGAGAMLTSTSSDLSLGTSDFTIELWAYRLGGAPANSTYMQLSAGTDLYSPVLGFVQGSEIQIYISSNNASWNIAAGQRWGTVQANTWVHYALTRQGSTFKAFENGIQQSTWTSSASIYQASNLVSIGKSQNTASENYKGYIDALRITKGIARYTGNFTPTTNSLTTINEDNVTSAGDTVAQIVPDGAITDVDYTPSTSAPESIAITAINNTNGTWQFKLGNGAWSNIDSTLLATQALLLDSTDSVRFVPNADWSGNSTFTYRAWDKTGGTTAGSYVTISSTGGSTPYSSEIGTALITVNAVNDAPVALADTATAIEAGGVSNGTAGTNPTGNVLTNDTDADAGDTKTVSGVAAGVLASASGSVGASVTGSFGSINIAANGAYTYTVDNTNAAVQALRTISNTLSDVFTYTMRDAAGVTSTTQLTITIQGANDTPTAVVDTATAIEAGGTTNGTAGTNPTGNVLTNDTDVDS